MKAAIAVGVLLFGLGACSPRPREPMHVHVRHYELDDRGDPVFASLFRPATMLWESVAAYESCWSEFGRRRSEWQEAEDKGDHVRAQRLRDVLADPFRADRISACAHGVIARLEHNTKVFRTADQRDCGDEMERVRVPLDDGGDTTFGGREGCVLRIYLSDQGRTRVESGRWLLVVPEQPRSEATQWQVLGDPFATLDACAIHRAAMTTWLTEEGGSKLALRLLERSKCLRDEQLEFVRQRAKLDTDAWSATSLSAHR